MNSCQEIEKLDTKFHKSSQLKWTLSPWPLSGALRLALWPQMRASQTPIRSRSALAMASSKAYFDVTAGIFVPGKNGARSCLEKWKTRMKIWPSVPREI